NFAVQPATSRATEIGLKARFLQRHRINAALFDITTKDEIVIDAATGGRTTFKNAGRTSRRGAELAWEGELAPTITAYVAYTYLRAVFDQDFTTGLPVQIVAAGTRLPGVPTHSGFAEIAWRPAFWHGVTAAVEFQHTGSLPVNERNTDAAPAATVVNARLGIERDFARMRLAGFMRLNNIADRRYAGSVIVGDTNGRYFEPAPGRSWFAGITARAAF
ncbi:MAG: TonB-dependent receptor, partial [Casimicrobiaceae bacterium]